MEKFGQVYEFISVFGQSLPFICGFDSDIDVGDIKYNSETYTSLCVHGKMC
jgi:hypothetical protein